MNTLNLNHFSKKKSIRAISPQFGQFGVSVRGIPYANKESPYATNRNCPAYTCGLSFRY